jgi:hypothetical protein
MASGTPRVNTLLPNDFRATAYAGRVRLVSCSRDPIGYEDGANLFGNYFMLRGVDPSGLSWTTEDFVWHYWTGWGMPIDLNDVGLAETFWNHASVQGEINRFKQDVVAALFERMAGLDCEAYSWSHNYSGRSGYQSDVTWTWTMFPIGDSALKFSSACSISVGACDKECNECRDFSLDCSFDYTLRDSFRDPLDFEEWGLGTLEVGIPFEIRSSRNEHSSTSGNTCESGGDPEIVPWMK